MENTIIGVVAIIYRENANGEHEFLLLRHKNSFWTFAGGKVEADDNSVLKGLQREIAEELGLCETDYKVTDSGIVNSFIYGNEKVDRAGKRGLTHYYIGELNQTAIPVCQAEIQELKWLTKDKILEYLAFEDMKSKFVEVSKTLER